MTEKADFEFILKSHFPIITIASYEEPRVLDLVQSIANNLSLEVFQWTITDGLLSKNSGNPPRFRSAALCPSPSQTANHTQATKPHYRRRF